MGRKRGLEIVMAIFILTGAYYIGRLGAEMRQMHQRIQAAGNVISCMEIQETQEIQENHQVKGKVVVDAGHGGFDSGKVGINGVLEKDINLKIAEKLKRILIDAGIEVEMIREEDVGLYDEVEENKKQQDMRRRVEKIENANADVAVSIHQNSYVEESVKGPQIFFYETSVSGKKLADIIQKRLNEGLEIEHPREKKGNNTYYILKKTPVPTVIIECGFLSNFEEAQLLIMDEYQEKIAKLVAEGIFIYLKEREITG